MIGITQENMFADFQKLHSKKARVAFLKLHQSYDPPFDIKWDNLIAYWLEHEEGNVVLGRMPSSYVEGDKNEFNDKETEL